MHSHQKDLRRASTHSSEGPRKASADSHKSKCSHSNPTSTAEPQGSSPDRDRQEHRTPLGDGPTAGG